jgi:hypothetical protein
MHSSRPPRGGSSPAALPALLRASHLFGLALGSALGKLRDSGVTAARMFERAEESALLLRMTREAAGILGARWDKVPERQRPHYVPEQRFRILRIRSFLGLSQRETAAMFRVSVETIARVGVRDDEARRRGPASAGRTESSRPALRRRGQSRRQDDGAGRLRWERSDRTDSGASWLEAVGTDGGTDPQGALADAASAGEGLDGAASREGKAPESRLDGGSDGRERPVLGS